MSNAATRIHYQITKCAPCWPRLAQETRDGELVVFHDATLARVAASSAQPPVAVGGLDLTTASLQVPFAGIIPSSKSMNDVLGAGRAAQLMLVVACVI